MDQEVARGGEVDERLRAAAMVGVHALGGAAIGLIDVLAGELHRERQAEHLAGAILAGQFFRRSIAAPEARRGQIVNDIEHHAETAAGRQRDAVIVIVHGLAQHRKRLLGGLTQHGIGAHPRDLGDRPARLGPIGAAPACHPPSLTWVVAPWRAEAPAAWAEVVEAEAWPATSPRVLMSYAPL